MKKILSWLLVSPRGCFEFCVKRLFLDTGGTDGNRQRANR
jgi:hypothetical protein